MLGLAPARRLATQRAPGGLRHALEQQDPGHDGAVGEMSLKLRLVEGYVLDPDAIFIGARFDDAIDQQHGIAVRQKGEEPLNVEDFEHLFRCLVHPALPLRRYWRLPRPRPRVKPRRCPAEASEPALRKRWWGMLKSTDTDPLGGPAPQDLRTSPCASKTT